MLLCGADCGYAVGKRVGVGMTALRARSFSQRHEC